MLFIKYISDKYADSDDFAPPVTIPKGASFKDMIALKGKPWNAPSEVVHPLGYDYPVFRRTRGWLGSERSPRTSC
jgi:hypothetical protein